MRTTLKRGIGRGISSNGNGRPILPPAALTPMTRYRQPVPEPPRGLRLVGRIVLWSLAAILIVATAAAGSAYLFVHETVDAAGPKSPDVKRAQTKLAKIAKPGHAAVTLFIGYDRRPGEARTDSFRSDTLMLVRADPQQNAVSMLSFPRDLQVEVTCPDHTPYVGKINEAYSICRAPGALATVQKLLKPQGVPINYLVTVNFVGFREVVDKLGGIWIDVDRRYLNTNGGRTYDTYAEINLWPGYQRVPGWKALEYVRFRHTDSDQHRTTRQQHFVRSLKQQMSNMGARDFLRVVGSITRNVEVAQGGGKDVEPNTVFRWAKFLRGLPNGHFFQSKIEGIEGYADLTTDPANIDKAIREFANPDVQAPRDATDVLRGRKLRVPRPAETTIAVLNGNGRDGSASEAAYLLSQRDYKIVLPPSGNPANAPNFDYGDTVVYYNPQYKRGLAAARSVERLFEPAVVLKLTPAIARLSNNAMLVVTVGQLFRGKLTPSPPPTTPVRKPPDVHWDPGMTMPNLRRVRGKLPFRLMLPTVVADGSSPELEAPARVYYLDPKGRTHRTLRLTYQTGLVGEEWGIQQTDWEDAPILAGKSKREVIKGRVYDLYYSGSRLHMVVLRHGDRSYWVVNTLSDTLTNETMLAIAKGLKPLPGKVGRA